MTCPKGTSDYLRFTQHPFITPGVLGDLAEVGRDAGHAAEEPWVKVIIGAPSFISSSKASWHFEMMQAKAVDMLIPISFCMTASKITLLNAGLQLIQLSAETGLANLDNLPSMLSMTSL